MATSCSVILPVVQTLYPICERGRMRPRSLSKSSRRCSSRKKPTPKTSGIMRSYTDVHSCLCRGHVLSKGSPTRWSASWRVSLMDAMCLRRMASRKPKSAALRLGVGYSRRCKSPSRDCTQCRTSNGALLVMRSLSTRDVWRKDRISATHNSLKMCRCSSFGSRNSASKKGLSKCKYPTCFHHQNTNKC